MEPSSKKMRMTIPENINRIINCSLGEYSTGIKHYAYQAIVLPCGGNACKQCAEDLDRDKEIDCNYCNKKHRKNDIKMQANPAVECLITTCMNDLKEKLFKELKESMENLTENKINEEIDIRFYNVENELDIRIESIIAGLDEYREDFKREMVEMKKKYKESIKSREFNKTKEKLDEFERYTATESDFNYEELIKCEKMINESKLILQKHKNELNEIKLNSSSKIVYKDFIGELNVPLWKKFESTSEIEIDHAVNLVYSVHLESNNILIITDDEGFLIKYNLNDQTSEKFTHPEIINPCSLCIGKNNQVFVLDETRKDKKIIVFDEEFNFNRKIKISNDTAAEFMNFDLHDDRNLIYLSECINNKVLVINSDNGEKVNRIVIDSPYDIQFKKDHIYITSYTDFEMDTGKKLKNIKEGLNCIFILNKSYEMIDKISFENWLQPRGLSIQDEYILTLAYELDKNKIISSDILYLNVIKGKTIVSKIKLHDASYQDFLFANNKAIFLKSSSIRFIEFNGFV